MNDVSAGDAYAYFFLTLIILLLACRIPFVQPFRLNIHFIHFDSFCYQINEVVCLVETITRLIGCTCRIGRFFLLAIETMLSHLSVNITSLSY